MQKVLLVGNGINSDTPGYKWQDLIQELLEFTGLQDEINVKGKPFPLLYEEIVLNSGKHRLPEKAVKEFIATKVQSIEPTETHAEISATPIHTILTTNYDHCLEESLKVPQNDLKNLGLIKESRYNLFRHLHNDKTQIWHIHGEAKTPSSIILGYEHYCGYLQYMRNYVVLGTGESYKKHIDPLRIRIAKRTELGISWLDHFFISDVYILGLTLDFVELHLWWLLTFRARVKLSGQFPIHNKITFFVPLPNAHDSKIELLESCDVKVIPMAYSKNKRSAYYKKALRRIIKNAN